MFLPLVAVEGRVVLRVEVGRDITEKQSSGRNETEVKDPTDRLKPCILK